MDGHSGKLDGSEGATDSLASVLLGISIVGLVVANIPGFALVWPAADIPVIQSTFAAWPDQVAWWLTQTLFSWTLVVLGLFAIGAGLGWLARRPSRTPASRYLTALLLVGVVHGYVFWFGDLIVVLALAGLVALAFDEAGTWTKTLVGGGLVLATLGLVVAGAALLALVPGDMDIGDVLGYPDARLAEVEAVWRSGFLDRWPSNLALVLQFELIQIVFLGGGVTGLLMLGMAAQQSGWLARSRTTETLALATALLLGIGLPLSGWGALQGMTTDFAPDVLWRGVSARAAGALLLAAGYGAAVRLATQESVLVTARAWLANAGRHALSLYLLHTLVLTLVFVGPPGLGLFGRMAQGGLFVLGVVLMAAQLGAVWLWSRHFRIGPAEWAVRSLAEWRRVPLRRQPAAG
ncbi:DUF418 domain-containing protein [Maricaulis sp. CAU 1757]